VFAVLDRSVHFTLYFKKVDEMKDKELYEHLSGQGIRIFALSLGPDRTFYIHPHKTVSEWRADVRRFILEINKVKDKDGYADGNVFNALTGKLLEAGYFGVDDMVADVYEGRVANYSSGIIDAPAHDEQVDGFGHYGWESKDKI
jgi:hypothetical protein